MISRNVAKTDFLPFAFTLVFGLMSLYRVELAFVAVLGMLAMMAFVKTPWLGLAAIAFILPFSNFPLWDRQIAGIPGMKVSNLLPLAVSAAYLFVNMKVRLRKRDLLFVAGIVFFLTIGVFKSLPHLTEINYSLDPKLGPAKYVLTYYVKPLIFLLPLILIASYVRNKDDIKILNNIVIASIAFFSMYLILFYLVEVPNKLSLTSVKNAISNKFDIHQNDLVNFYIVSYPVILANLLIRKNAFNLANVLMCLLGVGLLHSRTGYALIVFSSLLLLSLTKNKKWLPILIMAGTIAFSLISVEIVERSMTGLESGDINLITAGRTDNIWKPLIDEFTDKPADLVFGKGTNAIRYSKAFQRGYILRVGHAHNMYLESVLEVGILGMLFFTSFFLYYLFLFFKKLKVLDDHLKLLMSGIVVSILSFLISGLSGRQFLPNLGNSYLWIILGFGIAVIEANKGRNRLPGKAAEGADWPGCSAATKAAGRL